MSASKWLLVVCLGFQLVGCSKPKTISTIVSGRVTCKGEPVAGAGIRFYEARTGHGLVANLDEDGNYETPSPLPVGVYQVSIAGAQPGGPRVEGGPPPSPGAPDYVDKAFREGATSGLRAHVSLEDNVFDFDISEAPKKAKAAAGRMLVPMLPKTKKN